MLGGALLGQKKHAEADRNAQKALEKATFTHDRVLDEPQHDKGCRHR